MCASGEDTHPGNSEGSDQSTPLISDTLMWQLRSARLSLIASELLKDEAQIPEQIFFYLLISRTKRSFSYLVFSSAHYSKQNHLFLSDSYPEMVNIY